MDGRIQSDISAPGRIKSRRVQSLPHKSRLRLGIDIGSTSSDIAVLDSGGSLIYSDYKRTMGRPLETLCAQLDRLVADANHHQIVSVTITGSAGRLVAKLLNIPFVNEVPAQSGAISHLFPQFRQATIIEMGGQDSKLIFLRNENGHSRIHDFSLNTVCAAGTGSFLDQQAQRLGIDIEKQFAQMALESSNPPRMAGRCSVFAKSDMIHLQQQATPTCDILAGLSLALARNLKSNLGCGREFAKPIVFTGGVAANTGVVKALEQVFELQDGELVVPDEHFFTGAIGAILLSKSRTIPRDSIKNYIEKLGAYLAERGSALKHAPRRCRLSQPTMPVPVSKVYDELPASTDEPINAYLGVDVGSISTNVVVMDEERHVLAKAYLMTAGKPLEAVKQGLDIVGKKICGKVKILGAATTGSGRYLTGDFIGADIVVNEITAQAAGTAIVNPQVDTIFEIGGQDSKYISLENGVVVDFEMNHACAAGTGSFLEEQAQRLDININEEFAQLAFESAAPIKLGERCTVFMESDLLNYQQQGAKTSDLVAGLSYSIVTNYLNRVVGRRRIGNNICFQGGTAFNKAVWAAFEKVTGKTVMVPDHHEVTGALGVASIVAEHIKRINCDRQQQIESSFRGFENLINIRYTVESFTCEHCPNNCEIKKVQLPDSEPLYYGSRCDRYNLKKRTLRKDDFRAFEYRDRKLLEFAGLSGTGPSNSKTKATIGIPRALIYWQLLPLFSQFLKALGFEVVLSGKTDKRIIRNGVERVTAQTCFPVKVAYGHVCELLEKQLDYILLPSIVSMTANFPDNKHNQLCPYVQSLPYQIRAAFENRLGKTKILSAPIRMGEGDKLIRKGFVALAKELEAPAAKINRAIEKAFAAQEEFEAALKQKGAEILSKVASNEKLFVLVSRPYNGCDEGLNLQLPKKLAELGVNTIPMDMLDLDKAELSDKQLHSETYWSYGQKILRAAEVIRDDPRLFAIYLSNFSCGPDSFLMTFFRDIIAPKPSLQLELDEHSADAGVITRLEAYLESLRHYHSHQKPKQAKEKTSWFKSVDKKRTLYVPYMSDCSYGTAACFRAYGQPAEVIPIADENALLQGRRFTTGKECLPCTITTGDMLTLLKTKEPDKLAFFMPGGSGPCRFGMYNCMHRLILKYAGFADVPIISPNQDDGFYDQFAEALDGSATSGFTKDLWAATVGVDLLQKLILRLRPFAKDAKQAQRVYDEAVRRFVTVIEKRTSLQKKVEFMASVADEFAAVEMAETARKPRIGIVGEIYVRNHPFANKNIIARLEQLGAACDLASLAEWIYYTNFTRTRMAVRRGRFRNRLTNVTQDFFQHRIEKALAEPLEKRFGRLAEQNIEEVIELAKPYIHDSFEGEAILSVGKMVEYHHQGFGGVVNVMPFSCMPSTIVSTQTMRISADCDNMPILNISFDGQEDPTLTTRLEAFVEQVRQRKTAKLSLAGISEPAAERRY